MAYYLLYIGRGLIQLETAGPHRSADRSDVRKRRNWVYLTDKQTDIQSSRETLLQFTRELCVCLEVHRQRHDADLCRRRWRCWPACFHTPGCRRRTQDSGPYIADWCRVDPPSNHSNTAPSTARRAIAAARRSDFPITQFWKCKIIQSHQCWLQWNAHMRFSISD